MTTRELLEDLAVVDWVDPSLPDEKLIAEIIQWEVGVNQFFDHEMMFAVNGTYYDTED